MQRASSSNQHGGSGGGAWKRMTGAEPTSAPATGRRMTGFPLLTGAPSRFPRRELARLQVIYLKRRLREMPPGSNLHAEDRNFHLSRQQKMSFAGTLKDGSDGTRTRDLRRDRPSRAQRPPAAERL